MGWSLRLTALAAVTGTVLLALTCADRPMPCGGACEATPPLAGSEAHEEAHAASLVGRPARNRASASAGPEPEGAELPRLVLEVRVAGPREALAVPATVSWIQWGERANTRVAKEGVARYDLSDHVDECDRVRLVWATLTAEHPALLAEPATVFFPPDAALPRIVRTTIHMRAARTLRGRVVDAAGEPQSGAAVRLFALEDAEEGLDEGRCPYLEPRAWTRSDANGRYTLQTDLVGPAVVAAGAAHEDGLWRSQRPPVLPDAVRLVLAPDGVPAVRDLVVGLPVAIRGWVGVRGSPVEGLRVVARAVADPGAVRLDAESWPSWLWQGERAVPNGAMGSSDGGVFLLTGLAPAGYLVAPDDGSRLEIDPAVVAAHRRPAEAPAEGVVLDLDAVQVRIRVCDARGPLDGACVRVEASGEMLLSRTRNGESAVHLLAPGVAYRVRVTADGCENVEAVFEAPVDLDAVTWDVELGRVAPGETPEGGSLRVQVCGEGRPEWNVHVGLLDAQGSVLSRTYTDEDGCALFTDVPCGWWTVRASPDGLGAAVSWNRSPYALAVEASVLVERGVATTCALDPPRGGLLEVAVRDSQGRCVWAEVALHDAAGAAVPMQFMAPHAPGRPGFDDAWAVCPDGLLADTSSFGHQALAPGIYQIELRPEGRPPIRRRVEVHAGQVARVDVGVEVGD